MAEEKDEEKNPLEGHLGVAADPKAVKERTQKARSREQRDIDDLATILSDIRGRRFIWRYLGKCGVFRSSFNNSGSVTAYNEGMRNIGLDMLNEIMQADPDSYLLMTSEAKKENQNA